MNNIIKTGFLLINKPVGMSSYGCIGHIKRVLFHLPQSPFHFDLAPVTKESEVMGIKVRQKIKIGHAGTLDPFANGLLIVALGREATRHLSRIMLMEKTYIATGKYGELTDTLDCTGTVVATTDIIPSELSTQQALDTFGSSYEQIPPLYSALKYQGRPLYALARNKIMDTQQLEEIVHNKRRIIQLYDKKLVSYEVPFFTIQVRVSSGTYVRTLVNDIAIRSGSCATTYQLARIAIGPFNLDRAIDISSLITIDDVNAHIIPIDLFFP